MLRDESGFTIAELVTTMVVFGIVVVVISNLVFNNQTMQRRTGQLESATRAAQREVESLRNNHYNMLTPGENIDFTADLPADLPQNKTGLVVVSEPVPGLRRVDVNVTYYDNGKKQEVNLSSLIGMIGITQ